MMVNAEQPEATVVEPVLTHPLVTEITAQSIIDLSISFPCHIFANPLCNPRRPCDSVQFLDDLPPFPFFDQALPLQHGEHLSGNPKKENGELKHHTGFLFGTA